MTGSFRVLWRHSFFESLVQNLRIIARANISRRIAYALGAFFVGQNCLLLRHGGLIAR